MVRVQRREPPTKWADASKNSEAANSIPNIEVKTNVFVCGDPHRSQNRPEHPCKIWTTRRSSAYRISLSFAAELTTCLSPSQHSEDDEEDIRDIRASVMQAVKSTVRNSGDRYCCVLSVVNVVKINFFYSHYPSPLPRFRLPKTERVGIESVRKTDILSVCVDEVKWYGGTLGTDRPETAWSTNETHHFSVVSLLSLIYFSVATIAEATFGLIFDCCEKAAISIIPSLSHLLSIFGTFSVRTVSSTLFVVSLRRYGASIPSILIPRTLYAYHSMKLCSCPAWYCSRKLWFAIYVFEKEALIWLACSDA